jgi:undecaprenyl-diphosphatase
VTVRPRVPPGGDLRRSSARLIAPCTRGAAVALALLGAGITGVLGRRSAGVGRVDRRLGERVDLRHGAVGTLAQRVADLGGLVPVSLVSGLAAVPARRRHGRRGVGLVILGPALARMTTSLVLKPVVGRTKRGRLVYPSGHTTSVASLAVAVLVLAADGRSPRVRAVLVLGLAVPVVAVGAALVGRGYHDATDTAGGVGVAVAVVLTLALSLDAADPDHRATAVLPR